MHAAMGNNEMGLFRDRHDAGRQLAQRLLYYRHGAHTTVLALPRGGVVLGYEVSLALKVPVDVLVTRKLGTPVNPELAVGALAETGYLPPGGKPHRYYFRLYALDAVLDLTPRATKAQVVEACKKHILAEAQLMGRYGR